MWSGTTFNSQSGRVGGVHQRIDRIARRIVLKQLDDDFVFPSITDILHFEGNNGPDGVKRKSPGVDEPWHYIDPKKLDDAPLLTMIDEHIANLAQAFRDDNVSRASFEAAWVAHAITDGMTPPHHYPLEEKLSELRGGKGLETRITKRDKIILPGKNRREQLKNNWEYWGAKGVMTTHFGFEHGVMTVVAAHKFTIVPLPDKLLQDVETNGYSEVYKAAVLRVAQLGMYEEFYKKGWTRHLARQTREELIPMIAEMVALAWHEAVKQSDQA